MNFLEMTNFLDSFLDMGIPGFACRVYHRGNEIYRHRGGFSLIEEKTPFPYDGYYNMYSCSKPITCVAALKCYENGLLGLDDELCEYLPAFAEMKIKLGDCIRKAENRITIRQLFTMTAGFSYDLESPSIQRAKQETNGKCPTVKLMEYLAEEPLLFEPGERWEYGMSHDVLAAVVEVVSGRHFGEYVKKNIFKPIGMSNSTFSYSDVDVEKIEPQYWYDEQTHEIRNIGKGIHNFCLGSDYESGGAGCVSTTEDFIKFVEAMRIGDILLSKETTRLMQTNQLSNESLKNSWYYGKYGYGLGVRCPIAGSDVTDFGWGGAAGSFLDVDTENDITMFYTQHMLCAPNSELRVELPRMAKKAILK